jgi:hypothetical protein
MTTAAGSTPPVVVSAAFAGTLIDRVGLRRSSGRQARVHTHRLGRRDSGLRRSRCGA